MIRENITEQELSNMLRGLPIQIKNIDKQIALITLHADGTVDIIEHNTYNPYGDNYRFASIDEVYQRSLQDAERRAKQLMKLYQDLKDRERELNSVIKAMYCLEPEEYRIMHDLYIENQTWDCVSYCINVSKATIGRIRKKAVGKLLEEYARLVRQEKEYA